MSKDINIDGQLNFLEMMETYTDDRSVSLSVSKPRNEIKGRKGRETGMSILDGSPIEACNEQLSFSLDIINVGDEDCKPHDNGIVVKDIEKIDIVSSAKDIDVVTTIQEPEETVKADQTKEEPKNEPNEVAEIIPSVQDVEGSRKKTRLSKVKPKTSPGSDKVTLYDTCERCWCSDCRHNSRNEGKPREMCGIMMACPACETCLEQGYGEICEIGSAKEGCKTRAIEEGLFVEEESI